MEKFEKNIRRKFANRTIQPSASAWERMSENLTNVEQKKTRKWFWYLGYAASIAIVVSLFFMLNKDRELVPVTKDTFVFQNIDTFLVKPQIIEMVKESQDVLVSNESNFAPKNSTKNVRDIQITRKNPEFISQKNPLQIKILDTAFQPNIENTIQEIEKEIQNVVKPKIKTNHSIFVDSDALLFAVTHNEEEVKTFYKKYLISRKDALKEVQRQLDQSKLIIDPETVLAQVERGLIEESFQNNFFKSLKKRVSEVITFISTRND